MSKPVFKTQLCRMEDKEAQIAFDREFWREAGSSVIWDAAAEMTLEYYEAKGINPDEAVFQRTVTHIQRARG